MCKDSEKVEVYRDESEKIERKINVWRREKQRI